MVTTEYKSIWWDKGEYHINTRDPDGELRTIDKMLEVLKRVQTHIRNSSSLHDWGGDHGDHECRKCRTWVPGYTTHAELPERGCNNSRTLVIVAPRL